MLSLYLEINFFQNYDILQNFQKSFILIVFKNFRLIILIRSIQLTKEIKTI